MGLAVGTRLGPYEITGALGAGGMGEVYRARDTRLGRDVAIKVLPPDATADEDRRHRFAREARAASALSHPNIATVYDVGEADGLSFIAMECVEGRTLAAGLQGHPLPVRDLVAIALQAAEALEEAHARGIVHRDIKPGNLMITPRGRVKVLDFGLARFERRDGPRDETTVATRDGTTLGTVPYMSPEQALGRDVDGRSDLFSLGAVIYEMASGRRPFTGDTATEITDRILHAQPVPVTSLNGDAPADLDRIVRKCLEKDRERRYQSARDLVVDFGNLKRDLDLADSGTTAAVATAPAARRRAGRTALLAAVTVLALLATLASAWAWRVWRGSGAPAGSGVRIASLAVLPLANMTGDAGQEYFADGMTDALITELARVDPRALRVISRTSVMRFKKTEQALPEIAKQLGVEGVVEGAVMRSGGRVRVTARLIRATNEERLWSASFDREEENVLSLDSEVAQAIAGQVQAAIRPEDLSRPRTRRKVKPEAYDLVLQGTHLLKAGGSPDAFQRAIALFEKAVALDPQSVEAHSGLAGALGTLAGYGFARYEDLHARIRKEVETALALDPNYSWAQTVRGDLLWAERNPRGQMEAYRRAVELDPTNSTALYSYGYAVATLDSPQEGERLIRKAIEVDPLAQAPRCGLMTKLYAWRRYDEAEAEARKILDIDPNWFWAWDWLWRIHGWQGKAREAQEESRRSLTIAFGEAFKPPAGLSWEAYQRWVDRFLEAVPRSFVSGFLAASYARRDEKAKALEYLEAAATTNDVFLGMLDIPDFDSIRDDPRFQRIVENRHLPVGSFCVVPKTGKPR